MKRIDHLIGATVTEIDVGRNGTMRLFFKVRSDAEWSSDFNPLTVGIPREPKRRKKRKEARRG